MSWVRALGVWAGELPFPTACEIQPPSPATVPHAEGFAPSCALLWSMQGSFHPSHTQSQQWVLDSGGCGTWKIVVIPSWLCQLWATSPFFLQFPVFYPNTAFHRRRSDCSPGFLSGTA